MTTTENYCKDCGETVYEAEDGLGFPDCPKCGGNRFGGPDFDIPPHTVAPTIQLLEEIIELDKQAAEGKSAQ